MSRVPFTYTWIDADIMAGSIPQLPEDLDKLKHLGIHSILSLTRRKIWTYPNMQEWFNKNHAYPDYMYHCQYAIPDGGLSDDDTMFQAVSVLEEQRRRSESRPTYIHCRGGIGRTGTILLAYYVLHRKMSLEDAKEIVKVRRNYEGNASAIDQGSPQREWIDRLPDRVDEYWDRYKRHFQDIV